MGKKYSSGNHVFRSTVDDNLNKSKQREIENRNRKAKWKGVVFPDKIEITNKYKKTMNSILSYYKKKDMGDSKGLTPLSLLEETINLNFTLGLTPVTIEKEGGGDFPNGVKCVCYFNPKEIKMKLTNPHTGEEYNTLEYKLPKKNKST